MSLSSLLAYVIGGAGFFMLVKLRFFFILHPIKCLRSFFSEIGCQASRRALFLALAGTLGVGNIFGVAAGIMIGGAGSVFWLLVSSVFSMVLKYSETALAIKNCKDHHGGMHYVIENVFPKRGKTLGIIYALFCLLLSFFMGASVQSAAVAEVLEESFGIFFAGSALIIAFLVALVILKGTSGIEKTTSILIPIFALAYVLISLVAIFLRIDLLFSVFGKIISQAFSHTAAFGGAFSFLFSKALSEGFARGILSNEAGAGSSAMAHSRSKKREAEVGGLFGICEVFFDTVLLCPLTALVILIYVKEPFAYQGPMALVSAAFEAALGSSAVIILTVCTLVFAFSTIICWYYYGNECCIYLFGRSESFLYRFLFIFSIFFGVLANSFFLISVIDFALLMMVIITVSALIRSVDEIAKITKNIYNHRLH